MRLNNILPRFSIQNILSAVNVENMYPGLDYDFQRIGNYRFAVECKFREKFIKGRTRFATASRIDTYLQYQSENNIKVFIAIGIGRATISTRKVIYNAIGKD